MTPETLIPELILRVIGAFYCFGSILGVRMVTRYSFLDHALEAISGKKQPWAERFRERLMLTGMIPVFAGGLALMALSPFATWLFGICTIWQALYLGWLAPRYLDPYDDPGEEGRAKTWLAFWFYLVATLLVIVASLAGLLRGPADAFALAALAAATAGFGGWSFWSMRNTLKKDASPFAAFSNSDDPSEGWDDLSESGFKIREPEDISIVLRPSWGDGHVFDAEGKYPVSWGWQEQYLSQSARDMIGYLGDVFRDVADPYDPRRCALKKSEDAKTLEEAGQPALALLRQELGAERVRFEPLPAPVAPVTRADRIKIEPYDSYCVIWSLDEPIGETSRPLFEDEFGISWSLARHLSQWAGDWLDAHQTDDAQTASDPQPKWTDADFDAHEEQGRILAVRLKRELAATDRAHVMVYYMTRGVGLREAHAHEDIPPLP